jgi:transposase-like protein
VQQPDSDLIPSQDDIRVDVRELVLGTIRTTIETVMEQALNLIVGARPHERTDARRDVRNGSYSRRLMTTAGVVELDVPRTRTRGAAGAVIGRYKRRAPEIDAAITEAYVGGVSTRKMTDITEALLGEGVSRSSVSRVTARLEEQVEGLRRAPISEPVIYLYLDATFLDARWARQVENVSALVAYGVGLDGKRRLLAVTIGVSESEDSWTDLLEQLIARGLHGVQLVIADGHLGLKAAARRLLPEVTYQRCTVHLIRNITAKAPHRLRSRVAREAVRILHAPSLDDAKKRKAEFDVGLGAQVPEARACLDAGFDAATRYYAFPKEHWKRIRSTNGLERLHGEVKRRIKSIGAFPDRASALRLITAVALEVTTIWSDRRYLDVTQHVGDANHAAA